MRTLLCSYLFAMTGRLFCSMGLLKALQYHSFLFVILVAFGTAVGLWCKAALVVKPYRCCTGGVFVCKRYYLAPLGQLLVAILDLGVQLYKRSCAFYVGTFKQ